MPDVHSEMEAVAASLSSDDSQSSDTTATETSRESTTASPAIQGAHAATSTPADDDESSLPGEGAIPVSRVKKIIENARRKASTEVEGRFAWARDIKPDEYATHKQVLTWLDSDPVAFAEYLQTQLKADPRYAPRFGPVAPAETPKSVPEPGPDLMLPDGTMIYSHAQAQKHAAWHSDRVRTELTSEITPLKEFFTNWQRQTTGLSKAQAVLTEAQTWIGFKENVSDIHKLMSEDKRVTLESAYRRVVVPKLQADEKARRDTVRQEILAELQTRPAANTESPGRRSPKTPESTRGKSTEDVMRQVLAQMGG